MTGPARIPERELIPYEASRFSARSVLVLTPHADDEVFACGGALADLRTDGADVHVLLLSDGAGDELDPGRRKEIEAARRAESVEALSILGGASVETAGFPDRKLGDRVEEVASAILRVAAERRPDLVFAPSPVEIHPDHRAVAEALFLACARRGRDGPEALGSASVAFFELSQPFRPNFLVDITAHVGAKTRAMEAFASQLGGHDYLAFVHGLNAYRRMTLPRQVQAAEAYHVVPAARLARDGIDAIAAAIGPSRPSEGRQLLCIKRIQEAVMRLRNLFLVLFLGLTTVCAAPPAEARSPGARGGSGASHLRGGGGGRGGGGHWSGGHRSGGSWRGGSWRGGYWRGGYWRGGWGRPWGWGWGWGDPWWWGGGVVVYTEGASNPAPDRFGMVDMEVSPDSAEVYLEGKYIGSPDDFDGVPDYLYLLPGKYHVELRHPLYETVSVDLDVHRGEKVRLDREMKLRPGKGKLDAFDPPDRGTPLGRVFGARAVPVDPRGPANRRSPTWRSDDRTDYGIDVQTDEGRGRADVSPGEREERPLPRKAPVKPRITWKVSPDDASVYLDDRLLGSAEDLNDRNGTRVDAGKHTITVMRPGYRTKSIEVEAKGTDPVSVVVELEK